MSEAIALGAAALGTTAHNPAVGCVIVKGGRIVGRGATAAGGRPHAEPQAIAQAGKLARGATAYVSLEPCAHLGNTPPCANALVEAGVKRVLVACIDPYPKVNGGGIRILKRARIEVTTGVMESEARAVHEGFFTRVTKGRPMLVLKLAMTLDGRIATEGGDSQWISGEESRELVHRWRAQSDAVMVGAATVIADNPRLTCRISSGRDPARIVVDANLRTPPRSRVFIEKSSAPTILVTSTANLAKAKRIYSARIVEIIDAPESQGRIALAPLMQKMGARGYNRILLEGGANIAGSALREAVVDRIAIFVAPRILGGGLPAIDGLHFDAISKSIPLKELSVRHVGADLLIEARISSG